MAERHSPALPKGHRIDEYEIVRVLGAGGFGITYLAFDLHLDGPVAIKEYFPATVATRIDGRRVAAARPEDRAVFTWGLDRFIDEARSIYRFRHPNVVRAHRYVEAHDTAYIVMEYVEGESLQEILNSRGALPAPEWSRWLNPLLDGLAHVHRHGYLHRDVKPTNIVIRAADGEPVLIDFGAARVAAREQTHTRVLTPGYAPIEQHSSQAVQSPATDIYALAAVSYRVLTGAPPPDAPDRMLDDRYEPLSTRATNTDPTWLAAIDWGLRPRPEHRPQTVAAWRARMEAHDGREPGSRTASADSAGETGRSATGNPPLAAEPSPDTAPGCRPPQFESFSPLTGRTITYGCAHAVPMELDGYVALMEDCYLEPCAEPELSLPEQEESLLMTFYTMYSALQCGDQGFDRIVDEVLARLGDEGDHDDAHESWWRDQEYREIEGHLARGLERCGEDRIEVRDYVSCVEDWIAQCQGHCEEPDDQTDSDLESDVEELGSDIDTSTASVAERLSASAAWFDEWEKSKYAVDAFFECIRQLRLLHQNTFEAARTRVAWAISEITGSRAKL